MSLNVTDARSIAFQRERWIELVQFRRVAGVSLLTTALVVHSLLRRDAPAMRRIAFEMETRAFSSSRTHITATRIRLDGTDAERALRQKPLFAFASLPAASPSSCTAGGRASLPAFGAPHNIAGSAMPSERYRFTPSYGSSRRVNFAFPTTSEKCFSLLSERLPS